MTLYILLSAACLVALPILGAWYTGVEVLAPLWWRVQLLRQGAQAPRLLLPPPANEGALGLGWAGLAQARDPEVRAVLDEATATLPGAFTKDFVNQGGDRPVYVRTVARVVDPSGAHVGIPYTLEEHAQTRSVVVVFVVIDLRESLSPKVLAHVEAGREERAFGDEGLIAGLLNGELRTRLGKGDRLSVTEGFVVLESPFLLAERAPGPAITAVAALAARLEARIDPATRRPRVDGLLAENLESDPDVAVRAEAADMLLREHPERADWAAARALSDEAPEVRFAAARHLGEEGFQILLQIVFDDRDAEADHASDGLRQRALRFMVREFPFHRMEPHVERVLLDGPDGLRQIGLRKLGELRHVEGLPWIEAGLARATDPETVAAGCEAVARIGSQAGEGGLVALLDRPEPVIQRAAVEALAQVGTVGCVAALTKLVESAADREVRLSAATAIPIVQTRGAPEVLGALSLVDEERGQLALASSTEEGSAPRLRSGATRAEQAALSLDEG